MSPTKTYLLAYNTLNTLLWSTVLYRTLSTLVSTGGDVAAVYPSVGQFVRWTQSLIVLDSLHVLFGLVRTSLPTTLLQSFSRLFLVHAIIPSSPATAGQSLWYASMVVSWAIAEIVRYSYYVAAAGAGGGGGVPRWLAWARYNFFWVLYVTGAGSEWVCMWRAWPELKTATGGVGGLGGGEKGWMWWVVGGMLVAWPIFFPNQYTHMMALRRKMMRGKKKA